MTERDLNFKCPFDKKICVKSPRTPGNPPCSEKLMAPFDEDDVVFNPDNETGQKCGRDYMWRLKCGRYQKFMNDGRQEYETISDAKLQKAIETLAYVFNRLAFKNEMEKQVLFDSYMLNIKNMILHARQTGESPYDYIKTIQQELLKNSNVSRR